MGKVLVVDDLPVMRALIEQMLLELGYPDVVAIEDGEAAFELLQGDPEAFELVISDWKLAGFSGLDLLRAMRSTEELRETPFLMITATNDPDSLAEVRRAGLSETLVKPFQREQLAEALDHLVHREPDRQKNPKA